MGSDLYHVRVLAASGVDASLAIEVVHPDGNYIPDNPGFALMLLREAAFDAKNAPLAIEASMDDLLDAEWVSLYTLGFIERVHLTIESGSEEGIEPEQWLKGRIDITVTDPAWISHLSPGQEFASRAYAVFDSFDPCPPIHPGQVDPNAPPPEPWIAVPGKLWEDGPPGILRVAAYSASAYRMVDPREGEFGPEDLADLHEQVVLYQQPFDNSPQIGTFIISDGRISIYSVGAGYSSCMGPSPRFEGVLGRAEIIPGKRLGRRLALSDLLDHVAPELISATTDGTSATFRIRVPPGHTEWMHLSEGSQRALGFLLLVEPLRREEGVQNLLEPCPLAWTVEREVMRLFEPSERQITSYRNGQMVPEGDSMPSASALVPKLTDGFIASATLVGDPVAVDISAWDSLLEPQQRQALAQPWPELTLQVTPHHPAFVQHVSRMQLPIALPKYVPEPEPWNGPPASPAAEPTGFGKSSGQPAMAQGAMPTAAPSQGIDFRKISIYIGIGCGVLLLGVIALCVITVFFAAEE